MQRNESNYCYRKTIEPILTNGLSFNSNKTNWHKMEMRVFRALLIRITLRERTSTPGTVRNYWRKKRYHAAKHYENNWGNVPPVFHDRHIPKGLALFKTDGWRQWAVK